MEWDIAAGQIIVEETSGEVVKYDSTKTLKYNKENIKNPWFEAKTEDMKI
jgi:3'(2'), 5'-bisphosphate nucleotidase